MATYKQLLEKKALEEKLAEVRANEIAGVIEQIRALMAEYDLSVDDRSPQTGRPAGSKTRHSEPLPPKYRDPKTGATGRAAAARPARQEPRPLPDPGRRVIARGVRASRATCPGRPGQVNAFCLNISPVHGTASPPR